MFSVNVFFVKQDKRVKSRFGYLIYAIVKKLQNRPTWGRNF